MYYLPIKVTNAIHIFIIGTLLLYIGVQKQNTPRSAYLSLIGLAFAIFVVVPLPTLGMSYWHLIHIFHYLVVLPGLLYIAYLGVNKQISNNLYNTIGGIGVVVIAYHSYKLIGRLLK